jgi:probable metal-binding protein
MSDQIHGHDVMQMMVESKDTYTKESLEAAIHQKYGADARFYTCSAEGMTAKELIEFLEKRGKFVSSTNGFSTEASKICSHGDHHD